MYIDWRLSQGRTAEKRFMQALLHAVTRANIALEKRKEELRTVQFS